MIYFAPNGKKKSDQTDIKKWLIKFGSSTFSLHTQQHQQEQKKKQSNRSTLFNFKNEIIKAKTSSMYNMYRYLLLEFKEKKQNKKKRKKIIYKLFRF